MAQVQPLFHPPVLIRENHQLSDFNSGEPVLDEWLRHRAFANLESGASRTYVVCPKSTLRVVGYFSLSMGQILASEAIASMRRNMPQKIPAVVLGRLAIDNAFQSQGLGRALLADAMGRALRASQEVAAQLMIVHAISPIAEGFYQNHGFKRLPVDALMLAIDLTKYRAFAANR